MGVTPNGDQLKILTHRELVPQLGDVHIHGAQRGLGVHIPELLHKLGAGEDTLGVREELEQGVELPGRQRDLLTVTYRRLIVGVHHKAAHSQLVFAGDIGPPQQRPDPQHQLVQVNGFDHVIVDPCLIALLLGAVVVSGGHKENGNFAVNAPHSGGKLKAVDAGHHNIRYDQRIGTVVHLVVCVLGVPAARGLIAVAVQVIAHDAVELLIVFHNKYSQHICFRLKNGPDQAEQNDTGQHQGCQNRPECGQRRKEQAAPQRGHEDRQDRTQHQREPDQLVRKHLHPINSFRVFV